MVHYSVKNYSIVGFNDETPVTQCVGEYDLLLVKDVSTTINQYRWVDIKHNAILPGSFDSIDNAKRWLNSASCWLVSYVEDDGKVE